MDEARELFRSLSLPFPFELPQSLYAPGKSIKNIFEYRIRRFHD